MDTKRAQELYRKYAAGIAYVAVESPEGESSIGTAFHVGEGVFVTARHVVDNQKITEVSVTEPVAVPISEAIPMPPKVRAEYMARLGQEPRWPEHSPVLQVTGGPEFHRDPKVDVAVFRCAPTWPELPYVPLGSHLDDWIRDDSFVLSEAIILGYPRIPLTTAPRLVATRAEINCVVTTWRTSQCQFVVSAMPRGGFSGGVAISEWDFVLGIVTESLLSNDAPAELGFQNILSVEPILQCLGDAKMLPQCQREAWGDFWSTQSTYFCQQDGLVVACVSFCDDGSQHYIEVHCIDLTLVEVVVPSVEAGLPSPQFSRTEERAGWFRWTARTYDKALRERLSAAAEGANEVLGAYPFTGSAT